MSDLKPCPFCGSEATVPAMPIGITDDDAPVECTNLYCNASDVTFDKKEWNTRPIEDALRKEIAQLQADNRSLVDQMNQMALKPNQEIVGNAPKMLTLASLTPDFSNAKEGDECWLYGIGETGISSIGDDYVTVWDDENKYVFDKSGYLYFIGEHIGGAYSHGVSCELEDFPMLFNSFAQFQAYWAEKALEMGGNHD